MAKIKGRITYKEGRNHRIYQEYSAGNISIYKLASKYKMSPQRIHYIIHDYSKRGYAQLLSKDATKEEKKHFKEHAIKLREAGKYEVAHTLLQSVEEYEIKNKDFMELLDTYQQQVTTLNKIAKNKVRYSERVECLKLSKKYLAKALIIIQKEHLGEDMTSFIRVHLATTNMYIVRLLDENKKELLKEALKEVNKALKNYPKPKIQEMWPLIVKARVYFFQKRHELALQTLRKCEQIFHSEYKSIDLEKDISWKYRVITWSCMMHLTYALIYQELQETILMEQHAKLVLYSNAPLTELVELKKEARNILKIESD